MASWIATNDTNAPQFVKVYDNRSHQQPLQYVNAKIKPIKNVIDQTESNVAARLSGAKTRKQHLI